MFPLVPYGDIVNCDSMVYNDTVYMHTGRGHHSELKLSLIDLVLS